MNNDSLPACKIENFLTIDYEFSLSCLRLFDPRPHQMHMRILLRARAEAHEMAMPLLGTPEKLQLLNWNMYFDAGYTCVKESSTVAHPQQIRRLSGNLEQIQYPPANKLRRNKFADRNKFAVTPARYRHLTRPSSSSPARARPIDTSLAPLKTTPDIASCNKH